MRYLELEKCITYSSEVYWFLKIKEGHKNEYRSRKSNMLAKKLERIFDGEIDTVKHNNVTYEMRPSQFKVRNYPIYLVYRVNENVPCFFWYKDHPNNKENKQSTFTTSFLLIVDEDIELFEKYGYVVNDMREN